MGHETQEWGRSDLTRQQHCGIITAEEIASG